MKTINKILMALPFISVLYSCQAQPKNTQTTKVKIHGNCDMCQSTIEQAAYRKKIASANWDQRSKMAVLTFDSTQTNEDEILKRIAYAGYDNEKYLAPDDAYAKLPECCKYERNRKNGVTPADVINHQSHPKDTVKNENAVGETKQLSALFATYFNLKDALIKSDSKLASSMATELLKAYEKVEMDKMKEAEHNAWMNEMSDIKKHAEKIAGASSVEMQRKTFSALSENMHALVKVAGLDYTVYKQHCPMYNDGEGANWLSRENKVKNPYYGSQMLTCGKTVETIKK